MDRAGQVWVETNPWIKRLTVVLILSSVERSASTETEHHVFLLERGYATWWLEDERHTSWDRDVRMERLDLP